MSTIRTALGFGITVDGLLSIERATRAPKGQDNEQRITLVLRDSVHDMGWTVTGNISELSELLGVTQQELIEFGKKRQVLD